jgi:hypothetical protein
MREREMHERVQDLMDDAAVWPGASCRGQLHLMMRLHDCGRDLPGLQNCVRDLPGLHYLLNLLSGLRSRTDKASQYLGRPRKQ